MRINGLSHRFQPEPARTARSGGAHIALNSLGYDHGVWQLPEVFVLPGKMRHNNYFGVYMNIWQPNIQEYNYCKVVPYTVPVQKASTQLGKEN